MKTLRLLRNLAVVFLLLMALLTSRPGSGRTASTSGHGKACGIRPGYYGCSIGANGKCVDLPCKDGLFCFNYGCVN